MALSADRYRRVNLAKELGNAVTFDVLQLKNNYLRDSTNVLYQEIGYRNSLRELNLLLGESDDTKYEPVGQLVPDNLETSLAELRSLMLENNKSLKSLRYNQNILKSELNINENTWLPKLSLSSGVDYNTTRTKYQGFDASSSDNYDYYANLRLSVNIFNGGNTERALEKAKIDVEKGEYQISETQIRLENSLKSLVELYKLRNELYNVSLENLKSAELNLQIAEQKFDSGAISSFNFRDIQLVYLNAAFDKIQATYNLIDTEQAIKKLTGQIVYRR
jgi:outer membrane protein TolC